MYSRYEISAPTQPMRAVVIEDTEGILKGHHDEQMIDGDSDFSSQESSFGQGMMDAMEDWSESSLMEDDTMILTDQERAWSLELKELARQNRDLKPLSDMAYAQFAITYKGNHQEALIKMENLQTFKDMYQVDGSPSQGEQYLNSIMKLQPGFLLGLDTDHKTGEGIIILDNSKNYPSRAFEVHPHDTVLEQNWRDHVVGNYYMLRTVQPNLLAIREGAVVLGESTGMGWHNVNMAYENRVKEEFWAHYPIKFKRWMIYNTNPMATIYWNLIRKLFPEDIRDSLHLGCDVDPKANKRITLTDIYLYPNVEASRQRVIQGAKELLEERLRNEESFRLL